MRKIILEVEYCMKYDLLNVKIFQKNSLFHPEMILRPLFCFKDTKNTGLLIFNSLKQKKLIFNFFVNRNWKNLTDSRKRTEILADNRKTPLTLQFPFWILRVERDWVHAWTYGNLWSCITPGWNQWKRRQEREPSENIRRNHSLNLKWFGSDLFPELWVDL